MQASLPSQGRARPWAHMASEGSFGGVRDTEWSAHVRRFCQMMWRLNFLVTVTCVVLENSYMLYYICPMHTIFTIFVYACLGLGSKYNSSATGIWLK